MLNSAYKLISAEDAAKCSVLIYAVMKANTSYEDSSRSRNKYPESPSFMIDRHSLKDSLLKQCSTSRKCLIGATIIPIEIKFAAPWTT